MSAFVELSEAQGNALKWMLENKRYETDHDYGLCDELPRNADGKLIFTSRSLRALHDRELIAAEVGEFTHSSGGLIYAGTTAYRLNRSGNEPDVVVRVGHLDIEGMSLPRWRVGEWRGVSRLVWVAECKTAESADIVASAIASCYGKRAGTLASRLDRIEEALARLQENAS